ncbi:hypothetical protein P3S67_000343 [Capsicum chacoense]
MGQPESFRQATSSSRTPSFSQPPSSSRPPSFRQPPSFSQSPSSTRPPSFSQPPRFSMSQSFSQQPSFSSSMCIDTSAVIRVQLAGRSRGRGRDTDKGRGAGKGKGSGRGTGRGRVKESVSNQQLGEKRTIRASTSSVGQKRSKTTGFGICTDQMSRSKTLNPGTRGETVVTPGVYKDATQTTIDIGYKPRRMKWKENNVVTTS